MSRLHLVFSPRALALLLSCLVVACGGGGGSSDTGANDNTDGVNQVPVTTALAGRFLYSTSVPTDQTYLAAADASTSEVALTARVDPVIWPDASQYLEYTIGGAGADQINVFNTASRQLVYQVQVPNFCGRLKPSPVSKKLVLAQCYQSLLSNQGVVVVIDLESAALLHSGSDQPRRHKYRWLPDGSMLRVHDETGVISKAVVGATWQDVGQLAVPNSRRIEALEVNVQGTMLAVTFRGYSDFVREVASSDSDLWVSNLDGTFLGRVTLNGNVHGAKWSPDGSKLAFNVDTSSCGVASACGGTSSWWLAPSSARSLQGIVAGVSHASATQLQRRFPSGNVTPLVSVDLITWLP